MPAWNAESMRKHAGVQIPLVPLKYYVEKSYLIPNFGGAAVVRRFKNVRTYRSDHVFIARPSKKLIAYPIRNKKLGKKKLISPHVTRKIDF